MLSDKKVKALGLRHNSRIIILSAVVIMLAFGCAHTPQVKAPPPPKFTETEVGRVAVTSACFDPEFKCPHKPPTKLQGAVGGALVGFIGSIFSGFFVFPYAIPVGIVLSPVAAMGGAIYGAIEGETQKTIKEKEEILSNYLSGLRVQEMMLEKFFSLTRKMHRFTFVQMEQCGPKVLDEEIRYESLKEKDVDTVFEISIREFGLWREKEAINPPLSLFITVSVRLIRVKDSEVLSVRTFRYESKEKRKFTKWVENGAQPFREELDRCFGILAEMIVADLFIN